MAIVTYETPFGGGYPADVVETAKLFTELLFSPRRLGEVTHPDFVDLTPSGEKFLEGLPALQEYRAKFGHPELVSVRMVAVPPEKAALIPGTNTPYTIDHFFDLTFWLSVEDLPPGVEVDLPPATQILTVVRMREPYLIRAITPEEAERFGLEPGKLMVCGRTHWPVGEVTMSEPRGQFGLVARQAAYCARHYGATMVEDGLMRPLEDIMARELRLS
ncbi:MAG TPA: hypothetical protein VLA88_04525 [Candidatus Saccharimonadales bacterium]|nr:hypothetical protein [Candidatus Saccharimonadales bacterium]